MKNVIWHNPTNHTLDSPEVWRSMCRKSYTNTKKHKAQKHGKHGTGKTCSMTLSRRACTRPSGKKERPSSRQSWGRNHTMCWFEANEMCFFCDASEMCLLRIRFLQRKFWCQQVFGWQAGGFQHRATGWDYWVNIGSAWPSSFNSAYSCGVSMFCGVLSCDFTQHGAFLQEAEAAAKRAVAVTWIFAVA